ncbi:MAG: ABC transporter substrate-binding protein [Methanospirillum sp.]|uniref:ABC transporter substrate-binding protein n=1 Tax=Methanospirillum sp. TaxID=45200 RepID=UPI002374F90B|nr:ABC transporter substrate-binding protein [Methanospirillum sp.]MDD1728791.1 ABC transporter substrate-binding protein [Methanospirillum sp.]
MNLFRSFFICICLFLLCSVVFAENQTQTIVIGGLLPLSGNGSAQGPSYKAAMEMAAEDLNTKYTTLGLPYQVRLRIVDTETDPAIAKELGTEMIQDGIHFIVGPLSSEEMNALEGTAKESGTILIGFGSTTPGLCSQNNTIIRLCPDDTIQAQGLQALFKKENYSTIIPVVRNDVYGQKLYELMNNLSNHGNLTLTDPIMYEPGTGSFDPTIDKVAQSIQSRDRSSGLAVMIIGFDETTDILNAASKNSKLSSVSWVGTDGIALSDSILKNNTVAGFAAKTNFTATIYGEMENEPKFMKFAKRLQTATGLKATPYAVVINDAVQLAALTEIMSQGIPNKRPIFVDNACHFYGISGYTSVTDQGDRKYANIDFWTVKDNNGKYSWTKIGRYVNQMAGPIVEMKTKT